MNEQSIAECASVSSKTLSLRPYQVNAINETRQRMARVRSVLINAPTGAFLCPVKSSMADCAGKPKGLPASLRAGLLTPHTFATLV